MTSGPSALITKKTPNKNGLIKQKHISILVFVFLCVCFRPTNMPPQGRDNGQRGGKYRAWNRTRTHLFLVCNKTAKKENPWTLNTGATQPLSFHYVCIPGKRLNESLKGCINTNTMADHPDERRGRWPGGQVERHWWCSCEAMDPRVRRPEGLERDTSLLWGLFSALFGFFLHSRVHLYLDLQSCHRRGFRSRILYGQITLPLSLVRDSPGPGPRRITAATLTSRRSQSCFHFSLDVWNKTCVIHVYSLIENLGLNQKADWKSPVNVRICHTYHNIFSTFKKQYDLFCLCIWSMKIPVQNPNGGQPVNPNAERYY